MEVYGANPNMQNNGGNQFMPNKYQFATYYGQKNMMSGAGPQSQTMGQYEYSIDGNLQGGGIIAQSQ